MEKPNNAVKKSFLAPDRKKLLKYFLILLALNLFIFNWHYIAWIFNYRVIGEGIQQSVEAFNPENLIPALRNNPFTEPPEQQAQEPDFSYLSKANFLSIPKLSLSAPIVFTTSTSAKEFNRLLKKGTLHYPFSALPGEKGTAIILGHSSPPNWPKINYDWVFSNLNQLEAGDNFIIDFNGQQYTYTVQNKLFLKRGEEYSGLTNSQSVVMLVSCWPPGKDRQRIVIEGILED